MPNNLFNSFTEINKFELENVRRDCNHPLRYISIKTVLGVHKDTGFHSWGEISKKKCNNLISAIARFLKQPKKLCDNF